MPSSWQTNWRLDLRAVRVNDNGTTLPTPCRYCNTKAKRFRKPLVEASGLYKQQLDNRTDHPNSERRRFRLGCTTKDTLHHADADGGRGGNRGSCPYSSPYNAACSFKNSMNLNAELPLR